MVIVPGMGGNIDKGYLYIREVFSSEVVQRYLEGSPVRTSVSLYICIAPVVSFGRVMAHCRQEPSGVRQSFLTCGVWGRFSRLRQQMRKLATNATGGKPVGRGRWRTDEVDTGDEGLSATGTYCN